MIRCPVLALSLAALGLLSSCQSSSTKTAIQPNISRERGPANVAVLPVRTDPNAVTAPTEELRRALTEELLARGYSTLSRAVVDSQYRANPTSLSYPNSGMLDVLVHQWNDAHAQTEGRLYVDLEATFYGEDGGLVGTVRMAQNVQLESKAVSALSPPERRAQLLRQAITTLLEPFPGPPPL